MHGGLTARMTIEAIAGPPARPDMRSASRISPSQRPAGTPVQLIRGPAVGTNPQPAVAATTRPTARHAAAIDIRERVTGRPPRDVIAGKTRSAGDVAPGPWVQSSCQRGVKKSMTKLRCPPETHSPIPTYLNLGFIRFTQ